MKKIFLALLLTMSTMAYSKGYYVEGGFNFLVNKNIKQGTASVSLDVPLKFSSDFYLGFGGVVASGYGNIKDFDMGKAEKLNATYVPTTVIVTVTPGYTFKVRKNLDILLGVKLGAGGLINHYIDSNEEKLKGKTIFSTTTLVLGDLKVVYNNIVFGFNIGAEDFGLKSGELVSSSTEIENGKLKTTETYDLSASINDFSMDPITYTLGDTNDGKRSVHPNFIFKTGISIGYRF